jgi:hypothetical protein
MLQESVSLFLKTQDQPEVFNGVQRFRTVSRQSFLDRGTVRRGGLGGSSILRFASELKNMLLHIFRLEAKALPKRPARNRIGAQEPRALRRRGEDLNRGHPPSERESGRRLFKPQTVLLRRELSTAPES